MAERLAELTRVSQDGVRVWASAGGASFRRRGRLETRLAEVSARVEALRRALDNDPGAPTRRQAAARVSRTAPEARVMKMTARGARPAFNAQFATATAAQLIGGVDVRNVGSDLVQSAPMAEQLRERDAQAPAEMRVDGGFAAPDHFIAVARPEAGARSMRRRPRPGGHCAVAPADGGRGGPDDLQKAGRDKRVR